jgi:predicted CoA-binding protein
MTSRPSDPIEDFLAGDSYAVAGASRDRSKYGNRVLRAYLHHGRRAIPVNPHEPEVEGLATVPDVLALPEAVHGLSIITPPRVTERIVDQALEVGIRRIWMQPGAESASAIARARAAGATVIAGGPCVLVELPRHARTGS